MSHSPFTAIESELSDSDLVVGNLECFARGSGVNKKKFPRLSTNTETIRRMLQYMHCGLVTLANNHCYDNLDEGFLSTCEVLDQLRIKHIGAGVKDESLPCFFTSKDGIKLCFLNYITDNTNPKRPEDSIVKQNVYEREKVLDDINLCKNSADHVVLLFHWGGTMKDICIPVHYSLKMLNLSLMQERVLLSVGTLIPYNLTKYIRESTYIIVWGISALMTHIVKGK